MRTWILAPVFVAAGLLVAGLPLSTAADGEPVTLDLKAFTFKVKEELASLFNYSPEEDKLSFYTSGLAETPVKAPADGEYEITVKASCDPAQGERAKFKLFIDGQLVDKETLLVADEATEYKLKVQLKKGDHKLGVEFTNDVYKENEYDRNFYVHAVTLRPAGAR